jgi:hypothetical protein
MSCYVRRTFRKFTNATKSKKKANVQFQTVLLSQQWKHIWPADAVVDDF